MKCTRHSAVYIPLPACLTSYRCGRAHRRCAVLFLLFLGASALAAFYCALSLSIFLARERREDRFCVFFFVHRPRSDMIRFVSLYHFLYVYIRVVESGRFSLLNVYIYDILMGRAHRRIIWQAFKMHRCLP